MKDASIKTEGFATSHPLKQLGEKIATSVNLSIKDFNDSQVSKRLGVKIDWSSGTMIVQGIN